MKRGIFILMTVLAGYGAEAAEKSITTGDGKMGADSSVSFDSPEKNYGASGTLPVKAQVTVPKGAHKSYLRFDLEGAPKPVSGANLILHSTSLSFPKSGSISDMEFEVWGLADGAAAADGILGEDWAESEITWNNAPANSLESGRELIEEADAPIHAVHLGNFIIPSTSEGGEQRVIALESTTPSHPLVEFINQDQNGHVTFILVRPGNPASHNSVFASKERKKIPAPTLILTAP